MAQFLGNERLQDDGNYACWLSAHVGPAIFAPGYQLDGVSECITVQLNLELLNGILTPSFRHFTDMTNLFGNSSGDYRDFSIMYGGYSTFKAGVFTYSAGPCLTTGFKYPDDGWDIGFGKYQNPLEFEEGELLSAGLEVQGMAYLTFGVGYSIGFGFYSIYAPGLLSTGIDIALSLGAYKYPNKK